MAVISPKDNRIIYGDQVIIIHSIVPTDKKMPRIGQLSQKVTIEKRSAEGDGKGGRKYTWLKDFDTFAQVIPSTYKKSLEGLQIVFNLAYEIVIRSKNPRKEGRFLRIIGYTQA